MFKRRTVLTSGAVAMMAAAFGANDSEAATIGDGDEKKNVEVVKAMMEAWSAGDADKVASFFTEDATFRGSAEHLAKARPALEGRAAMRASVAGVAKMAKLKMTVADVFARGSLVVASHYQVFEMLNPKEEREDWYLGVFFFKDGKIQEWNDYGLIEFSQPRQQHPPQFGKFLRF